MLNDILKIKKRREHSIRRKIRKDNEYVEKLLLHRNKLFIEHGHLLDEWRVSINTHGNYTLNKLNGLRSILSNFERKEQHISKEIQNTLSEIEVKNKEITFQEQLLKKNLREQEKLIILEETQ